MAIRIIDPSVEGVPIPMISKQANLVVAPHMGARLAVMNLVHLEPGEKNQPHSHAESEDSIFLLAGSGWAHDLETGTTHAIEAGCAVLVPAGLRHAIEAGPEGMISVGGPVPPDWAMLRAAGVDIARP